MKFSVISAVNNINDYERYVIGSLAADEFLYVQNGKSASEALNKGIQNAENDLCVLCHQDVIFPKDWPKYLEEIKGLDFGVCGVWGITLSGEFAGNVIEPRGHWKLGDLPAKAQSVDELLMIVRKSSGLWFDEDLDGWHLYGADLCLQAMDQGKTNYIIDAPVEHLSMGKIDEEFERIQQLLAEKWRGKSQYNWPCPLIETFKTPNTEIRL